MPLVRPNPANQLLKAIGLHGQRHKSLELFRRKYKVNFYFHSVTLVSILAARRHRHGGTAGVATAGVRRRAAGCGGDTEGGEGSEGSEGGENPCRASGGKKRRCKRQRRAKGRKSGSDKRRADESAERRVTEAAERRAADRK